MVKKIFSGVQPTGNLHLGNYLGAIKNFVELQNENQNKCIYCVVDLHAITIKQDPKVLKNNIRETTAAFLASGLDHKKSIIFNQSLVPAHSEGSWILGCIARMGWLNRMTQFKEKAGKDKEKASIGLYIYPVLMAADILLYDSEIVPVGKDQKQHLEITRDIAKSFNHNYGETFIIPESKIDKNVQTIPGTDGRKMSKTYENTIDIFADEKSLKKQIMSIVTDSKGLEDKKNPESCNIFNIFKLIAGDDEVKKMKKNYSEGGYGYGHAKTDLFNIILELYRDERKLYSELLENPDHLYGILIKGEEKARVIADKVLERVRSKLGY